MSSRQADADTARNRQLIGGPAGAGGVLPLMLAWLLPMLASWVAAIWYYPRLPAQVPVHWNIAGQPDRWGSPLELSLVIPAAQLLIALLFGFTLQRCFGGQPGRSAFAWMGVFVLSFLFFVQLVTTLSAAGSKLPILGMLAAGCGVLFILMGNLLPKLGPNPVAGARLPSVMHDRAAWIRTQRAAGLGFVVLGAALLLLAMLPGSWPLLAVIAGKGIVVAYVIWYALRLSRENRRSP